MECADVSYPLPCMYTDIKGLLLLNKGIWYYRAAWTLINCQVESSEAIFTRAYSGEFVGFSTSLLHVNPCRKQCTGTGKLALVHRWMD